MIRPARRDDRDALFPLARAFATSYAVEAAAFGVTLDALLGRDDACLLVVDERPLGGYLLGFEHPSFYANGPVGWVEELMVDAEARRGGRGRALMTAFEDWARARGCALVALATRRAAPFYAAIGYEESAAYFRKRLRER